MSADLYQGEATKFFREQLGFHTHKVVDMHFEDKRGFTSRNNSDKKIMPVEAGHFDMIFLDDCRSGVCEVKTGEATSFPFSKVRQDQIDWYWRVAVPKRLSAWIYFVVGERARQDADAVWELIRDERRKKTDKKREMPRVTVLMPFGTYLEHVEKHTRKSFAYEYIMDVLYPYRLLWRGGTWQLPERHIFNQLGGTHGQYTGLPRSGTEVPGGCSTQEPHNGVARRIAAAGSCDCAGGNGIQSCDQRGRGIAEDFHPRLALSPYGNGIGETLSLYPRTI